jgi:tRNA (guanine37-N1)-methyltransferase
VFWNSRLGTEHERIIIDIKSQDRPSIVFDVFAGVGPFVIPAVFYKKIIKAYANDLNPLAIEYLNENLKLNDVSFYLNI